MANKQEAGRKKPKRTGGSVKWTQTRFSPYVEAVRQFKEQIWKFYGKSKKAKDVNVFARIKFELVWDNKEFADFYNANLENKEKARR